MDNENVYANSLDDNDYIYNETYVGEGDFNDEEYDYYYEEPLISLFDIVKEYDKGKVKALNGINLDIFEGEFVSIIGPSGSGKSTLVNLLLRFYDTESGAVKMNGVDIKDFSLEYLQSKIAVVFQDTYLFQDTILENIRMAKPDASREEVMEAAKAAGAHEFIMQTPNGYDSLLGERGITLSGGERQRLSIARAILKDAPILILDEARPHRLRSYG